MQTENQKAQLAGKATCEGCHIRLATHEPSKEVEGKIYHDYCANRLLYRIDRELREFVARPLAPIGAGRVLLFSRR